MDEQVNLPERTQDWTKEHVKEWVTNCLQIDEKYGQILHVEEVSGQVLSVLTEKDLIDMGLPRGPALLIKRRFKNLNSIASKSNNQDSGQFTHTKPSKKEHTKNTQQTEKEKTSVLSSNDHDLSEVQNTKEQEFSTEKKCPK